MAGQKNIQVRVDTAKWDRVSALAKAMGHEHVSEFVEELIDQALDDAQNRINQLKARVQQQNADRLKAQIAALDALAAAAAKD